MEPLRRPPAGAGRERPEQGDASDTREVVEVALFGESELGWLCTDDESARHQPGSANGGDGELGVVEGAEREAGHDHDATSCAPRPGTRQGQQRAAVGVETHRHSARALDEGEVVVGRNPGDVSRELLGARDRDAAQPRRCVGCERVVESDELVHVDATAQRATVAMSLGSPVPTPVCAGLIAHTSQAGVSGNDGAGRRHHGLAHSRAGAGDDDDGHPLALELTEPPRHRLDLGIGQRRARAEAEPAHTVGHRRRAEAAHPNAVGCECRLRDHGFAGPAHRHRQDGSGGPRVAESAAGMATGTGGHASARWGSSGVAVMTSRAASAAAAEAGARPVS